MSPASARACALTLLGILTAQSAIAAIQTAGRTTTAGSTFYTGQQNVLSATQVRTGAASGTLASVVVYVGNVHAAPLNHMQVAIYRDNGANAPGSLVTQSASSSLQSHTWNTFALSATSITANTSYYPGTLNLVLWCEHSGGHTWPTWVGPAVRAFFLSQP